MKAESISSVLMSYFDGDIAKALDWIHTRNPAFGDVSPAFMMANGKGERLLEWMQEQMERNQ